MNPQNVDTTILAEKTESETIPALAADGVRIDATTEEVGLDDLLDYQPFPLRADESIVFGWLGRAVASRAVLVRAIA